MPHEKYWRMVKNIEKIEQKMESKMNKKKVYDLPTRIFHWLFAGLFLSAFFIAKVIDDDSSLYSYHMLAGFFMVFLVVLRLGWGLIGSKYARFSSFKLAPSELLQYFSSVIGTKSKRYFGHNPASSYASLGMFCFTFGLALTGILMSKGIGKDFFEEVHELFAAGFIITVILHIVGVALHHLKHKDGLPFSMMNGVKDDVEGEPEIDSNHPIVAFVFVGLIIIFGLYLNQNYDSNTQVLNLFGAQVELGEDDHKHSKKKARSHDDFENDKHEDEHDDDD